MKFISTVVASYQNREIIRQEEANGAREKRVSTTSEKLIETYCIVLLPYRRSAPSMKVIRSHVTVKCVPR